MAMDLSPENVQGSCFPKAHPKGWDAKNTYLTVVTFRSVCTPPTITEQSPGIGESPLYSVIPVSWSMQLRGCYTDSFPRGMQDARGWSRRAADGNQ